MKSVTEWMCVCVCVCVYVFQWFNDNIDIVLSLSLSHSQVSDEKEKLTSDLDKLRRRVVDGTVEGGVSAVGGGSSEELTRLQAQNVALQKSLQGTLW